MFFFFYLTVSNFMLQNKCGETWQCFFYVLTSISFSLLVEFLAIKMQSCQFFHQLFVHAIRSSFFFHCIREMSRNNSSMIISRQTSKLLTVNIKELLFHFKYLLLFINIHSMLHSLYINMADL